MTDKVEVIGKAVDEFKSINDVMHYIQKNVSVPKSRHNAFGKYNYRSAEDIVDAIKEIMPANSYLHLEDDIVLAGERFYVKATATLRWGKESISASGLAREEDAKKGMDGSQVTGACSSYARKYALNGLFAIDDSVDADATNTHGKEEKKEKPIAFSDIKKMIMEAETLDVLKDLLTKIPSGLSEEQKEELRNAKDERKAALMIRGAK